MGPKGYSDTEMNVNIRLSYSMDLIIIPDP